MTLKTIIYASSAAQGFEEGSLYSILESSRRNNLRSGVSGVLLYGDWNFLQVLEGEEDAVDATYARIMKDPRHQRLMCFYEGAIKQRGFPGWEMGFERAPTTAENGLFKLSYETLENRLKPEVCDEVQTLLRTFYGTLAPHHEKKIKTSA